VSVDAPQLPVPSRPVARLLPAAPAPPEPVDDGSSHRRPDDVPAPVQTRRFESLLVFLFAWAVFAAIGYRAVVMQHIVPSDAMNLMSRAFYVWHNDPAKLAAVGFTGPPLQTVGLLPFAIVKPLASGLVALPIASGFWGAVTLTMIHRTMARCGIPLLRRVAMTVLIALNPLWLFYSGVGMPDMVYLAALAATIYFVFTWIVEDQPRFVAGVGLGLALMAMSRFGFIWWALAVAIVASVVLAARNADNDEREGLLVTMLAPIAAALMIWVLACVMITGEPFGWVLDAQPFGGVSSDSRTQPADAEAILKSLGELLLGVAPVALLSLVGLVWRRSQDDDRIAGGQLFLLVVGALVVVGNALVHDDVSLLTIRSALPLMVLGIAAAVWLVRTHGGVGQFMAFAALIAAIPIAAFAMDRYPYQNLEQAFVRGVLTQQDQEGTSSRGGYSVGVGPEQRMAAFIKVLAGTKRNSVLADNATTGGVILLTGRPEVFLDRVDQGDGPFLRVLRNPWGKVDYIVVARGTRDGSINQLYPKAAAGGQPGLQRVFAAGRYVLLSVAGTDPKIAAKKAQDAMDAAAAGNGPGGATGGTGTTGTPGATGGADAAPGSTGGAGASSAPGTSSSDGTAATPGSSAGDPDAAAQDGTAPSDGASGDGLDAPILTPVP
jgi:hypothetical protein